MRNFRYLSLALIILILTTSFVYQQTDELNLCADGIAKKIGADIQITEKDGIPEINNPGNKERFAARLRNEEKVESVALLFLVNNYYQDDISVTINYLDTREVEFAVMSYKYPAIIEQNILNLFGAANLYNTLYRRNDNKIKMALQYFPDDIIQDFYARNFNKLEIGDYTKYLIRCSPVLDPRYQLLLADKVTNF